MEENINEKTNTGITIGESVKILFMLCAYELGISIVFIILGEVFMLLGLNGIGPYINLCGRLTVYIIVLRMLYKKDNYKLKVKYNFKFIECCLILLILTGYILVYDNSIELLLLNISKNSWYTEAIKDIMNTPIAAFISIAVIAPVFEEAFFRGIILEQLSKRYNSTKAILVSAILFGVIHLNISQGVGAFLTGIILGLIYLKTRSVIPCILLHFANNFFCFLVLNLQIDYKIEFNAVKLIVGLIILTISLYIFKNYNKNTKKVGQSIQV